MTPATPDILLVAVNARYSHCAYAARSLQANLGRLAETAAILESDLDITPLQLASQIAEARPRVVGFSVYLWNVRLVEAVARILRAIAPHIRLVAGGPEMTAGYPSAALFDAVIVGEGESAFRGFCEQEGLPHFDCAQGRQRPAPTVLTADPEDTAALSLPYNL